MDQRNLQVLRLILVVVMAIFGLNLGLTLVNARLSAAGYWDLRLAYLTLLTASVGGYLLLRRRRSGSMFMVYLFYSFMFAYCSLTSAFISDQFISVIILAVVFQIPILYLDNSLRLELFVVLGAVAYLLVIWPFKADGLRADELLNILGFAMAGLLIGRLVRSTVMENFSMKTTLQRYAYTDPLTGLANRRQLFESLEDWAALTRVTGMAVLDVDFFKNYNDSCGHQAGDVCLARIAQCFLGFEERPGLRFHRYGGEEFLVVLEGYAPRELPGLVVEIRRAVEALAIPHPAAAAGVVTISAGVAAFGPNDREYAGLLYKADKALYAAKADGRNTVAVYLEGDDLCALERNGFIQQGARGLPTML